MTLKKIVYLLCWISPILALVRDTKGALSDGYYDRLLTDPGHVRVRFYDRMVLLVSWSFVVFIVHIGVMHYGPYYILFGDLIFYLAILFPYFSSIYLTILLYAISILVNVYDKNRATMIRSINERKGVW